MLLSFLRPRKKLWKKSTIVWSSWRLTFKRQRQKGDSEPREVYSRRRPGVKSCFQSGSGKTTLLCNTINKIKDQYKLAVIEGDQQTLNDAERIRATGCRAIQINTGEGCHLDADMIEEACRKIKPEPNSILFIENVGNLVCPAAFDLGEDCKVVVLSVTEGEDKPIKYPDMFAASSLMLINKVDLLPYVDFSVEKCKEYARRVNPNIEFIEVSATKGTGMDAWCDWSANVFPLFQSNLASAAERIYD